MPADSQKNRPRPAVLCILDGWGERAGREVRYRFTPAPLSEAVTWMAQVGAQWDDRLASLAGAFRGR